MNEIGRGGGDRNASVLRNGASYVLSVELELWKSPKCLVGHTRDTHGGMCTPDVIAKCFVDFRPDHAGARTQQSFISDSEAPRLNSASLPPNY